MRSLFIGLIAVAALAVAVVLGVPYLVPSSTIEARLADFVKKATGHDLIVRGSSRFSLLPRIGVDFEDVSFAQPAEGDDQPLITARRMTAELKLWPLLERRFVLGAVTFHDPIVELRRDENGRENWKFGDDIRRRITTTQSADTASIPAHAAKPPRASKTSPLHATSAFDDPASALVRLGIERIRLVNGVIRYHDRRTRQYQEASAVNLLLKLPDLLKTAQVEGEFTWRGEPLRIDAKLGSIGDVVIGRSSPLTVQLSSALGAISFDGQIVSAEDMELSGKVSGQAVSLPDILNWLRIDAPLGGMDTATLASDIKANGKHIALTNVALGLSDMSGRGNVELVIGANHTSLSGRLDFDRLDLGKFRSSKNERKKAGLEGLELIPRAKAAPGKADREADDAPPLPLDFSASLKLTAGEVLHKAIRAQGGQADVKLQDGQLQVELKRLQLYGGSAQGALNVDGRAADPILSASFRLEHVEAMPLLEAASSFDWLSGKLSGEVALASGGKTSRTIREMLRGTARFRIDNGAIVGVDLPYMLSQLQSGELTGWERVPQDQTPFKLLQASWKIDNGIARTTDLSLQGPSVAADGDGAVNLVRDRMDIRLRPQISPDQATTEDDRGLVEIPIRIKGKLDNPKILPDVDHVLENPEKSVESIKSFGKAVEKLTKGRITKEDFGRALDSLFGKKRKDDDEGDEGDVKHKPFDAQKFF